jgi:GTPase SAR1 family protein
VFWKVVKKLLFGKDRVVIVGSPGVGKSCFLTLSRSTWRAREEEGASHSWLENKQPCERRGGF